MILEDPIAPGVHKLPCGDKYSIRWFPAPKGDRMNCVYIFNLIPDGDSVFDAVPSAMAATLHSFNVNVFEYQICGIDAYYTCWYAMIEEMDGYCRNSIYWISHGTDAGLLMPIPGKEIRKPNMLWGDFASMLLQIPEQHRDKMLLCLSSCEGMNFEAAGFYNDVPLYEQLIGSYNKIKPQEAIVGFSTIYYHHFFNNQSPVELMERANCAIGKPLFKNQHGPLQAYVNKYLTSNGISVSPFVTNYMKRAHALSDRAK